MQSGPQLRMDGSKYFSTVHGERPPGDPLQHVHFYQDGLPFDAGRLLLTEMIENDERLKALAAKKLSRQPKQKAVEIVDDGDDGDHTPQDQPDDEDDGKSDVNLEMWLTGDAKYDFNKHIRGAIADRYQRRGINSVLNAVEFLVNEQKIVPVERLCPGFQLLLTPKAA
jgi:hypothetical protein